MRQVKAIFALFGTFSTFKQKVQYCTNRQTKTDFLSLEISHTQNIVLSAVWCGTYKKIQTPSGKFSENKVNFAFQC